MRKVEYLSPTSISLWSKSKEEFYLRYLADNRPPRESQTQPMSIGSSFDAYCKSFLYEALFGKNNDSKFALDTIFKSQVEDHNREWALDHGKYAFECYKQSGALNDLMLELQQAIGSPKFELEVRGIVDGRKEGVTKNVGGVVLLGKPDVFYVNKNGTHVILDWKVNGWCSSRTTSPMAGYIKLRSINKIHGGPHKNANLMQWNGQMINAGHFLENLNIDWARQLCIYAWLCGVNVGEKFIVAVDQLVCSPSGGKYPEIRVAEHRLRVSDDFQWKTFCEAEEIWESIQTGHIFRELTIEESREKCRLLERQSNALSGGGTDQDQWFAEVTRRPVW